MITWKEGKMDKRIGKWWGSNWLVSSAKLSSIHMLIYMAMYFYLIPDPFDFSISPTCSTPKAALIMTSLDLPLTLNIYRERHM